MATGAVGEGAQSGRWVYLPEEFAAQHPLYGPHGWALAVLLLLILGPMALLLQDYDVLQTVYRVPVEFYGLIAAEVLLLLCAWSAAYRLSAEREDFYGRFYLTVVLGICCGLLFFAITIEGMPRQYATLAIHGALERIVPLLIMALYVRNSKRIAVTCRKRVDVRDPFLRAQLTGDQTFEEAAAARPRRPWFFRRMAESVGGGRRQSDMQATEAAAAAPRARPLRPPRRPAPTT